MSEGGAEVAVHGWSILMTSSGEIYHVLTSGLSKLNKSKVTTTCVFKAPILIRMTLKQMACFLSIYILRFSRSYVKGCSLPTPAHMDCIGLTASQKSSDAWCKTKKSASYHFVQLCVKCVYHCTDSKVFVFFVSLFTLAWLRLQAAPLKQLSVKQPHLCIALLRIKKKALLTVATWKQLFVETM